MQICTGVANLTVLCLIGNWNREGAGLVVGGTGWGSGNGLAQRQPPTQQRVLPAPGFAQPAWLCFQGLPLAVCVGGGFWAKPSCLSGDVYRGDVSSTPGRVCCSHHLGSKNLAPNISAIKTKVHVQSLRGKNKKEQETFPIHL